MKTTSLHNWTSLLAGALFVSSFVAFAAEEKSSDVAPTEEEARQYCDDAASREQILAEDMQSYLAQCIAEYLESPPGDLGVSPEPGSSGY
jgi:hypothetical protein